MEKTTNTVPIRDLMPERYTSIISEKEGIDASFISRVVTQEQTGSYVWPFVAELAKETDSKAYAARMEFLARRDKAREAMKQARRRTAA